MALTSPRWAGDDRLERCAAGDFSARLVPDTVGDFVALVQQALIDLGESLPQFGADRGYGQETVAAVLSYKTARDIRSPDGSIDGIVGPKTMTSLDEECTARDQIPGPCPPTANGPEIDLGGADEQLVNLVLANTGAAQVVGVDAAGATRLLIDGVPDAGPPAADAVVAAAALFADDGVAAVEPLVASLVELAGVYANAGFAEHASAFVSGQTWPHTVNPGPALVAFLLQQIANLDAGAATPVRDLTKPAALSLANSHHALGDIVLTPAPVVQPDGTFAPGDPKRKVRIASTIAGVKFMHTQFADRTQASYAPAAQFLPGLDIRHVVGLVRFAKFVSSNFGVTEVHHVGIGGDGGSGVHHEGRACDFVGVRGSSAGTPFLLTVLNDWALKTVPNRAHPAKPRLPKWPTGNNGPLEYRLATLPGADPLATDFFARVYDFARREYQDRTDGPGQTAPPSEIGQGSRIMTCDHPDSDPPPAPGAKPGPNGREAHDTHMHWQVGPLGPQAP